MKVRPILFNAGMVRALLDGSKVQTRRLMPGWQKPEPTSNDEWIGIAQKHPRYGFCVVGKTESECASELQKHGVSPHGKPGDLLYVRETSHEDIVGSISLSKYSAYFTREG